MKKVMMVVKVGVTVKAAARDRHLQDDAAVLDSAQVQFGCEDIFLGDS
jgi:hypothetical protein